MGGHDRHRPRTVVMLWLVCAQAGAAHAQRVAASPSCARVFSRASGGGWQRIERCGPRAPRTQRTQSSRRHDRSCRSQGRDTSREPSVRCDAVISAAAGSRDCQFLNPRTAWHINGAQDYLAVDRCIR